MKRLSGQNCFSLINNTFCLKSCKKHRILENLGFLPGQILPHLGAEIAVLFKRRSYHFASILC
jgi:hypothetical protein